MTGDCEPFSCVVFFSFLFFYDSDGKCQVVFTVYLWIAAVFVNDELTEIMLFKKLRSDILPPFAFFFIFRFCSAHCFMTQVVFGGRLFVIKDCAQ